jgi:small-conductance mechanosensitive channel
MLTRWEQAAIVLVGSPLVVEGAFRLAGLLARRGGPKGRPPRAFPRLLRRSRWSVEALAVSVAGTASVHLAPARLRAGLGEVARVAVIASVVWMVMTAVGVAVELATARFDLSIADNRGARRAVTQLGVVRRVADMIVVVVGILVILTSLPQARTVGASLLASAGVLTIVAGIAGQSTVGNVIAGLQVAFSDALRLDDVVVVQGEWGRIEQLALTYVVVKIWDERRLVLPVSYFVTNPFENWTRTSAQILGSVHLFVDYRVPVDELRAELERYVRQHPLWDQRVVVLQVVGTTELAIQLRALVSSRGSSESWDLRCAVREHLLVYLRDHHPDALPRIRIDPPGPPPTSGAPLARAAAGAGPPGVEQADHRRR